MEVRSNLKKQKTKARYDRSDIFYCLVPINHVGRVCGLVPVKLSQKKIGQIDIPLLTYGITLALALTAAQSWGLYRDLHHTWQSRTRLSPKLYMAVTASEVFSVTSVTVFAILGSSSRWKHVLQALDKIVQADAKLEFATTKNLRRSSIILIACTLIYITYIAVSSYVLTGMHIKDKNSDNGPINYCPLYLMHTVTMVLLMQYAIILMNLGERFTKLNGIIQDLIKTNVTIDYFRDDMGLDFRAAAPERRRAASQPFVSVNRSRQRRFNRALRLIEGGIDASGTTESIDQLIKVYDLLCDSIIHLNRAFGGQLLMCTICCLVHLVAWLYFLWGERRRFSLGDWYVLMCHFGWISFYIYQLFMFVQPPHMVASKVGNTGSLVSQALAKNWNHQAQRQLESFALQLFHRPVEFTACGLFYVDRGLMSTIAGAVTTYLAILVQFQSKSNEDAIRASLQNAWLLPKKISFDGSS